MTGTPFLFRYQARRWMAGVLAVLCLLTQSVFAHQSETTFWAERKQHLAQSKQKPLQTVLATPLTALPLATRGEISLTQTHHSPETTLPSWLKNLSLPGTFRSAHWRKAPGEGPVVFLVEDLHSLYDAQKNVAALLSGIREAILRQSGEDPLIGLEGGAGPFHIQELLLHKHHPRYTEACDTLLKKNLIQGPEWLALSSANKPNLWGAENPQLYGEHLKSFRALWPRREKDLAEVDRQREILKAHIKDDLSPEQQHIQILLDAFTEGGVGLLSLTQALRCKINPAQAPHLNQLLMAADSETSLNFPQAERERQELARLLLRRGSPTPTPAPGESAQAVGALLSGLGLSWDPFPAYARYLRYADAVDRLDRFALFEEMSRLRQQLSRDPGMSPQLQTALQLRERLRLARRLISRDMTPSDWEAWENTSSTPPVREPWIQNIQVFLDKLQPYNSFYQWADRRSAVLIQRLNEERKNQNLSYAILVAGGFHTPDLQTFCDRRGLSSVVVTPLVEKAPRSTPHLSLLAREQIPLTELLAGEKLQLALGRPFSEMPSQFLSVSRDTVLQVFLRLLGEVPEPLLSQVTTLLTKVDISLLATGPALFSSELFSSLVALGAASTTHLKDEHPLPREDRGIHAFYKHIERTFDPDKIVVGFADVDHLGLLNTLLGKALLGDLSGQKLAGAELFNVPLFRMFFEVFRDELKQDGIDLFHGPGGDEMRLCYFKEKGAIEPKDIRKAAARAVTAFNKRFQEFAVFEITPPQDKDGNASASDEESLKETLKNLYMRVGNLGPSSRGGGRWLLLLPKSEQTPSEISESILNTLKTEKHLPCQVRHLDFESGDAETSRGFATLTLGLVNLGGLKNYLKIETPSKWALLMAGFFVANDLSVTLKENGVRNASLYLHNPDDFWEHTNPYNIKRIQSFMDHPPSPPTAQQLEEEGVDHLLDLPTPGAFRDQARRLRESGSLSLVESRPVSYTGEIHSYRAFHGAQTRLGSHHGGNELIKKLMGDILEKTQKARRLLAGRSPPDGLMTIIAETPANALRVAPGNTFHIEVENKPFDITVVETVTAFDPQNPGQAYKTSSDLHQLAALILSQHEEDGRLNTTKNLENLKKYARVKVIWRDRRPALIRLSPKQRASKLINEFLKKETTKTYERIIQSPAVASVFPNLFKNPSLPSAPQIPSYEQALKDVAGHLNRREDVVIATISFDWLSTLRGVYGPHLLGNWDDTPTPATYIKEGTTSLQSQLMSSLLSDPGDIKFYIGPAADKLVAIAPKTPSVARTFFHQRVDRVRAQFRDRYGVIRMEGSIDEAQLVGWAKNHPTVLKIVPYAGGLHILIDSREAQDTETPLITTLADTVGSLQKQFPMASVFPISLERKSRGVFSLSVGAIRSRQATWLSPGAPGVLLLSSKAAEWAKENGHDQTYCAFSEPQLKDLKEQPDPLTNKSLTRQEIWTDTLSRWLGKDHFLEKWKAASTQDHFQNSPSLEVVENIWDVLQARALKGGRINTWFQNVQTARQLLDWGADANTVLAGLLGQEPADKIKDILNLEPMKTLSSLAQEMESFTFRLDNDLKNQPDLVHDALGAYISRLPQAGERAWPVLLLDTARRQTRLSHEFRQDPSRDAQRMDELKWIHSLLLEWLGRHEMAAALRDRLFFLQSPEKRDEATSFFSQDTYLTYEGAEKWLKNLASRISATPLTQKDEIPEKAKVMATRAKQPHSLNRKKDSWAVQDLLGIALAMPHFDLNGQRNSLNEIKDWLSHFGEVVEKNEEKGKRGVKTSDSKYGYDGYHVYLKVTDPETDVKRTVELILFAGEYNYWRYRSGTGARLAYTLEREMPAQGIYWTTRQLSGETQADLKAIQEEIQGYTFIRVSLPGKEHPVHLSFPHGSLVCDLMADLRINPKHQSFRVKDINSISLGLETPIKPNTLYALENSEEQLSIPDKAQSPGSLLLKISPLPIENPSDESFKSFLYQVRDHKNKALIHLLNRTHLTGQEERFFRLIQWLEINQPEHSLLLDYQQALAEKCRLRHTPAEKGSGRIDILIAYDRPGVLAEALRRARGNGFELKEYPQFDSPGKDMRVRLSFDSFQEENLKARFERLLEQLKGLDDRPVGQTSAMAPGNSFELVVKPTGQAGPLDSLKLFEDLILALENVQANLLAIEKPGDGNNLNLRILFTLDDTGKGVLENNLQDYFGVESHRYILRKIGLGQSSSSPSNSNLGLWTLWDPWISTRSEGWKTRLAVVFALIVEEVVFLGGWLIFADLLGSFISGGVIAPGQLLHEVFASGLLEAPSNFSQVLSPDLLLPLALSFLWAHWATTYLAHPRLAHWESGRVVFEKNRASLQQRLSLSRDLAITRLFTLFLGPWLALVINAVSHGAYEFRNGENLPQVKRKLSKLLRGVKDNPQIRLETLRLLNGRDSNVTSHRLRKALKSLGAKNSSA